MRRASRTPITALLLSINVIYGIILAINNWSTMLIYQWGGMIGSMPKEQPIGQLPPFVMLPSTLTQYIPDIMNHVITGIPLIIIRSIEASFLQFSWTHLIGNVISLYILGEMYETINIKGTLLPVYLITGSISMISAYVLQPEALTAGASGAIFGIMGVIVIMSIRAKRKFDTQQINYATYYKHKLAFEYVVGLLILNLIITFTTSGISVYGHIFGLISGVILGLILPIKKIN